MVWTDRRSESRAFLLEVSSVEQKEAGYCAYEKIQYSAQIADAIAQVWSGVSFAAAFVLHGSRFGICA